MFNLPKLRGTAGMIGWATSLRKDFIFQYGHLLAHAQSENPLHRAACRAVTLQLLQSDSNVWLDRKPKIAGAMMQIKADVAALIRADVGSKCQPGSLVEFLLRSNKKAVSDCMKSIRVNPHLVEQQFLPRLLVPAHN